MTADEVFMLHPELYLAINKIGFEGVRLRLEHDADPTPERAAALQKLLWQQDLLGELVEEIIDEEERKV